ncbi:MAG: LysR family transcriptional regulator [Oceanicaulis sp.]|nr:LysR family transcriptional regulator [Oceanicaulis sp.]
MHIRMEWRSVQFDWNRARAFLVTAEEGSLSAAAKALGLTQPTLGRQVAALEAELGVELFERSGRSLKLTASGLELVEHVRAMGAAAGRVSLSAAGQAQSIEGVTRISASEVAAAYVLAPVIGRLRQAAPGMTIEVLATNAASDLLRREADIALRGFRPQQPDLIARRLRDTRIRLYATPRYLNSLPRENSAPALSRAEYIGFDDSERMIELLNARGLKLGYRNFPVLTLSQLVQWEWVKQGVGIGLMLEEVGDNESLVRRVLPDEDPIQYPAWLVAHRGLRTSRRVQLVFESLAEHLG